MTRGNIPAALLDPRFVEIGLWLAKTLDILAVVVGRCFNDPSVCCTERESASGEGIFVVWS